MFIFANVKNYIDAYTSIKNELYKWTVKENSELKIQREIKIEREREKEYR